LLPPLALLIVPNWIDAINNGNNSLFLTIGPGDFWYTTRSRWAYHRLILVKGALDARGSKLMPDKRLRLRLPCDGPGRGGTCDISAWDFFAMFWMLNTIGWVTSTGTGSIWLGKATWLSMSPLPT